MAKKRGDDVRVNESLQELFSIIMLKLDAELKDQGYLTGIKISIVDIMMVIEIQTICVMYSKSIPENFVKLTQWYDKIVNEEAIQKV